MSRRVLWVIQSIVPTLDAEQLKSACASNGVATLVTECRASDERLPDVAADRLVLFYGSCRFIRKIVLSGQWTPAAYYDEAKFRYSESLRHWGTRMLNHEIDLMPVADFDADRYSGRREIFVRPDKDLKEFSGCVWPVSDFAKYVDKIRSANNNAALATPIVVAPKKRIDSEWRLFIVDGRVCTGSRYELYGDLDYATELPAELVAFAEETAAIWSPARAFVLDLATVDSSISVLEFNGINSAGFYRADVDRLVGAIIRGIPDSAT